MELFQQLEFHTKLETYIQERVEKKIVHEEKDTSDDITLLATALAQAQGDFKSIYYNRSNSYYDQSYADLEAINTATRPSLSKNGLSTYFRNQTTNDGYTILHTFLQHKSGQWIRSRVRLIPSKNDLKTYESTLNKLKSLELSNILGISMIDNPMDDDAEVAMVEAKEIIARGPAKKNQTVETISHDQLKELEYELVSEPDLGEQILHEKNIQSLCDLPKAAYRHTIDQVRRIKRARNTPV